MIEGEAIPFAPTFLVWSVLWISIVMVIIRMLLTAKPPDTFDKSWPSGGRHEFVEVLCSRVG